MILAAQDTTALLDRVEQRYNSAQTLTVNFTETYAVQGRPKVAETGVLSLRKPGRMRWEYTKPAGKLFVSDGKYLYYYSPDTRRAERGKVKETEDMRAPLAFLLGRLDFKRDFKEFRTKAAENGFLSITALPKSEKAPYTEVTFLAAPDGAIQKLTVIGQDRSVLEFLFAGEKRNGPVADKLFTFVPPAGTEFVDLAEK
jgi:outer membrane lipoprotein carrier protein